MQQKKIIDILGSLVLLINLWACVEVKDKNSSGPESSEPAPVRVNPSTPSAPSESSSLKKNSSEKDSRELAKWRLVPGARPQEYSIVWSFAEKGDFNHVAIKKTAAQGKLLKGSDENTLLRPAPSEELQWEDSSIVAGEEVIYDFGFLDESGKFNSVQSTSIQVPEDLVVAGDLDLSQKISHLSGAKILKWGRLIFQPHARLILGGQSVKIFAEQIFSDQGEITSFVLGTKAVNETEARSGGNVEIKAGKLVGSLQLTPRGEDGSDGNFQGRDSLLDGLSGVNGEKLLCGDSPTGPPSYPITYPCDCSNPRVKAWPGGDGRPGHDGRNGKQGGATGIWSLDIAGVELSQIIVNKQPGLGGSPGNPGPGGLAGPGGNYGLISGHCIPEGLQGDFFPNKDTPASNPKFIVPDRAPNGQAGPPGNPGRPGHDGIVQPVLVNGQAI